MSTYVRGMFIALSVVALVVGGVMLQGDLPRELDKFTSAEVYGGVLCWEADGPQNCATFTTSDCVNDGTCDPSTHACLMVGMIERHTSTINNCELTNGDTSHKEIDTTNVIHCKTLYNCQMSCILVLGNYSCVEDALNPYHPQFGEQYTECTWKTDNCINIAG